MSNYTSSDLISQAKLYLQDGFSVIPVRKGTKRPLVVWDQYQTRRPTLEELEKLFKRNGTGGIAVICGRVSGGLIVVDFDGQNFALISTEFEEKFPEIAYQTRRVKTGSGKLHIWLRCPNLPEKLTRIEWRFSDLGDAAVELRANDHYVLAPPSLHPSGKPYRFLNDKPILEIPWDKMEEIIAWFDNRGKRTVAQEKAQDAPRKGETTHRNKEPIIRKAAEYYLEKALAVATPGNRNDTGFWLALQLRDLGMSETEAESYMQRYAAAVPQGDEPYTEDEALASLKSAFKGTPREPAIPGVRKFRKFTPSGRAVEAVDIDPEIVEVLVRHEVSESGNAETFRDLFGNRFCYVKERDKWFMFDGVRWDERDEAARLAMLETIRLRRKAGIMLDDDDPVKEELIKQCRKVGKAKLNNSLDLARDHLTKSYTEFDTDPYLLACANGVVDLRTGELRPSKPGDMLHKSTGIRFDPSVKCHRWFRFLDEIFLGDEEVIDFVWRAIGYTLTGSTSEQAIFICYGTGANGKSTFLSVLEEMLGEYAVSTPATTFKEKKYDDIPTDVAMMCGARYVKSVEIKENIRLNEERIKALTGGDKIVARFLHRDYFEFTPTFKIWWAVNHKPVIRGTDYAIWRRIRLIPFEAEFKPDSPETEPQEKLLSDLRAELPGILAWAVEGCLEWQQRGLQPVEKVKVATEKYRLESDVIARFLDECTIPKPNARVKASELFQEYKRWAEENGEVMMTGQMFGRRVSEKGFEKHKVGSYVYYFGLGLLAQDNKDN